MVPRRSGALSAPERSGGTARRNLGLGQPMDTCFARRSLRHSGASRRDRSQQAIAKVEAVRGNAARLAGTPTPCLCKRPRQDGVAARILFVRTRRATGSEPGARMCT